MATSLRSKASLLAARAKMCKLRSMCAHSNLDGIVKFPDKSEDTMKTQRTVAVLTIAVLFMLSHSNVADAAEIQVLCSNGLKAVMQDLAPQFERATGHKVVMKFGLAAGFKQQIQAG